MPSASWSVFERGIRSAPDPFSLVLICSQWIAPTSEKYADNEKTVLIVNDHIRVSGIPAEAHRYEVNGRTPLAWFIDRYRVKRDTKSGIVNDPNGWFKDPRDLIVALRRIVHLSVETVRIVERLPEPFQPEQMDLSIKG